MCAGVSRETAAHGHEQAGSAAGAGNEPVSRETEPAPSTPRRNPLSRALVFALLLPLRVYRRYITAALPPRCRYYPTCSAYAEQAVRELGPFKGTVLAVWRVLRCNPLSSGGLDPLENRRLFRSGTPEEPAAPSPKTV